MEIDDVEEDEKILGAMKTRKLISNKMKYQMELEMAMIAMGLISKGRDAGEAWSWGWSFCNHDRGKEKHRGLPLKMSSQN